MCVIPNVPAANEEMDISNLCRRQIVPRTKIVQVINYKTEVNDNIFELTRPVVWIAQFFGGLPVYNFSGNSYKRMHFKWLSMRSLFIYLKVATGFVMTFCEARKLSERGVNANSLAGPIFFFDTAVINIIFIKLARDWMKILSFWHQNERDLLKYPYKLDEPLRKRVCYIVSIFSVAAFVEHLLSVAVHVKNEVELVRFCNWTIESPLEYHAENTFENFFDIFPNYLPIYLYIQLMNVCLTFSWNYMDLFIMILGYILSKRFAQITTRMQQNGHVIESEFFWQEVRLNHTRLCEIVEMLDEQLKHLIPVSCLTNIYFVCLQILNVSLPLPSIVDKIYFWFSLIFLIARTNLMLYMTSKIHEESQRPIRRIATVPTAGWGAELERFWVQLTGWQPVLSGGRFFYLTREIMFSVKILFSFSVVMTFSSLSSIFSDGRVYRNL
jgi:gustatory receptor